MKTRSDFVTNSSSSSFVIAYKKLPEIDEQTLEKYPFLKAYKEVIHKLLMDGNGSYETEESIVVENEKDLQKYIIDEIGVYEYPNHTFEYIYKHDEEARYIYDLCKSKLNEGYKILLKEVGYDDIRNDLFMEMASDDFIILEGGD